jgi:hypothetical protein
LYAQNENQKILTKNLEIAEIDYSNLEFDVSTFVDDELNTTILEEGGEPQNVNNTYTAQIKTSDISFGLIAVTKSVESVKVEYSNVLGADTNINTTVDIDGVNVHDDNDPNSNQVNLTAFEYGESFYGEAQFGEKDRNIFILDQQNFTNLTTNEGIRMSVGVSNSQPMPFYVSRLEFQYLTLDLLGDNSGEAGATLQE